MDSHHVSDARSAGRKVPACLSEVFAHTHKYTCAYGSNLVIIIVVVSYVLHMYGKHTCTNLESLDAASVVLVVVVVAEYGGVI